MAIAKATGTVFKAGDLAVYPAHGVGIIEGIKERQIAGKDHSFYVLKILGSDATIMVPIANVEMVGLRKIMKKSMIPFHRNLHGHEPETKTEQDSLHCVSANSEKRLTV